MLEKTDRQIQQQAKLDGYQVTLKQVRFAKAIVAGQNQTQAAKTAGYSNRSERSLINQGSLNMTKDGVKYLTDNLYADLDVSQIDEESIVKNLLAIGHKGYKEGQLGASLRATELIGKNIGMWSDKQDLGGGVTFVIKGLEPEPKVIEQDEDEDETPNLKEISG